MSLKDMILERILNNKYFKNIVIYDAPFVIERYYIIPTGDKSNVFSETLNNYALPNTEVMATQDYIYSNNLIYVNGSPMYITVYYDTKQMIDLSKYTKLKYHFSITRDREWPLTIILIDKSNKEISLASFYDSGEFEGEIDISQYNEEYTIRISPAANKTYLYYFYLE